MSTPPAIFAGGCFWCLQADFDKLPGVLETQAGYDGGHTPNPTYEQVCGGTTGHAEALKVVCDPQQLSYTDLLNYFWRHIDPTIKDAQFCDYGKQYRTAIFYLTAEQQQQALATRATLQQRFGAIQTEIAPSTGFYPAEDYHQKYYLKQPLAYQQYRDNCGREARLRELWSAKPAEGEM